MSPAAVLMAQAALCFGQGNPSQPGPTNQEIVELRPRFAVGRPLVYRITEKQTIADQAEGAQPIHTTSVVWLRLTPIDATETGTSLLARVERMQWTVQGPGQPVSFDSSVGKTRGEPKEFSTFRDLLTHRFQVSVDSNGRVTEVSGVESSQADAARQAGTANIRRWLTMLSAWLPDGPIAVREIWDREESLSLGLVEMSRKNRLRVSKTDNQRVYIEGQIELSGRGGNGIMEGSDRLVASVVAAGPGKSDIVFHRISGVVERIESRVAFEMRVIRIPADQDQTPIVSAQKLSAKALVELLDGNGKNDR